MIQSLQRAAAILDILEALPDPEAGIGVRELSKTMELKVPTVHSFLKTLCLLRYVEQVPETRAYRLGARFTHTGAGIRARRTLLELVRPYVERLNREIEETTMLVAWHEGERHTLLVRESARVLRAVSPRDPDREFYTTASGRLLLAMLPEGERSRLREELGPPSAAVWPEAAGADGWTAVMGELRRRAFCEVHKPDIVGLAISLHEPVTQINAALGVYLPASRYDAASRDRILSRLCAAAGEIRKFLAM